MRTTTPDPAEMQRTWTEFEERVGLHGRKMYGLMDKQNGLYAVCTPLRDGDAPERLGVELGTLPGGWYLRGRLEAEPPGLYDLIAPAFDALRLLAARDTARPEVEFYRRRDQIDVWMPIVAPPR
jgi:hypothetical protein